MEPVPARARWAFVLLLLLWLILTLSAVFYEVPDGGGTMPRAENFAASILR